MSLNCVLKRYQLKIKLGLSHTFVQCAPQDGAAIHCKSIIKNLLFTVVPGERQSLSRKAGARQKIKKTKKTFQYTHQYTHQYPAVVWGWNI